MGDRLGTPSAVSFSTRLIAMGGRKVGYLVIPERFPVNLLLTAYFYIITTSVHLLN